MESRVGFTLSIESGWALATRTKSFGNVEMWKIRWKHWRIFGELLLITNSLFALGLRNKMADMKWDILYTHGNMNRRSLHCWMLVGPNFGDKSPQSSPFSCRRLHSSNGTGIFLLENFPSRVSFSRTLKPTMANSNKPFWTGKLFRLIFLKQTTKDERHGT